MELYDTERAEAQRALRETTTNIRTELLEKMLMLVPKEVEWIRRKDGTFGCPKCRYEVSTTIGERFAYCPNCGSIIKGKVEP